MTIAFSRPPKALLLDIDNTIYPYSPCHAAGLESAYQQSQDLGLWKKDRSAFQQAYDAARLDVKTRIHTHAACHSRLLYFKQMVEAVRGFTSLDETCHLEQAYWEGYASRMAADPECGPVLQRISESGTRLAWISNYTTARQIWKLKLLGFDNLQSVLVTSEEAGADKPCPAVVDLALARLEMSNDDIRGGDVWLVGDERADIEAARSHNLPLLFLCREGAPADMSADHELPVRDWKQIGEIFSRARN